MWREGEYRKREYRRREYRRRGVWEEYGKSVWECVWGESGGRGRGAWEREREIWLERGGRVSDRKINNFH